MPSAGIVGGAGYTAGELLRILLLHPDIEVAFVQSASHAGEPLCSAHEDLIGETDLLFVEEGDPSDVDVLFLCSGHGRSRSYVEGILPGYKGAIVDLSQDFRLASEARDFVYGLPEAFREKIKSCESKHVANPGCFATAMQLAVLPAVVAGIVDGDIHITGITGSTGAGQNPSATTHFSWRSSNLSVYKPFTHQHLHEVRQTLGYFGYGGMVNFVPVRGDFPRGILASVYFNCSKSGEEVGQCYTDYYADEPFVRICHGPVDMKMAVGTNRCILSVSKYGDKVHVVSLIDNLLKGASGQAVENANLLLGLPETAGLRFKAQRF